MMTAHPNIGIVGATMADTRTSADAWPAPPPRWRRLARLGR